ncbi:MAG: hypothetical protein ABIQ13_09065 [Pedococcus sp.]
MTRRGWGLVLVAATVLALAALASNATTTSQMEAESNTLLAVRTTVSMLVNAGTVWAGLAVLSGWLVRRPVGAFAAGVIALLVALVVHYGVGLLLGMFDPDVWTENQLYFLAAVVLGGPLALVGAIARRPDLRGVLARLVVPAGAVLEPFVVGMFTSPAIMPWPGRVAGTVSGVLLLTAGTVGCIKVLGVARRQKSWTRGRRAVAGT